MASDNISGAAGSGILTIILPPGRIWQRLMYMSVSGAKGYGLDSHSECNTGMHVDEAACDINDITCWAADPTP